MPVRKTIPRSNTHWRSWLRVCSTSFSTLLVLISIFSRRRIRSLESHVAEISRTQLSISEKLSELLHHVRSGVPITNRSPSAPAFPKSPNSSKSPNLSAQNVAAQHTSPPSATTPFTAMHSLPPPKHRNSLPGTGYQGSSSNHSIGPDDHLAPLYGNFQGGSNYNVHTSSSQNPILPPFSSIQSMAPPLTQSNISSMRYQSGDQNYSRVTDKYPSSSTKRQAMSNVPSADSSDVEEEENGELPASGLVAPWEVLRGLADVAIERATKVRSICLHGLNFICYGCRMAIRSHLAELDLHLLKCVHNLDPLRGGSYDTGYLSLSCSKMVGDKGHSHAISDPCLS